MHVGLALLVRAPVGAEHLDETGPPVERDGAVIRGEDPQVQAARIIGLSRNAVRARLVQLGLLAVAEQG